MTNTEKFILKENGAKETVTEILKVFNGKSYKFANAALNAAKIFLNEDSTFQAANALKKIEALTEIKSADTSKNNPVKNAKKKTVNDILSGREIYKAVYGANPEKNYFLGALKHATVTDFSDDVLTLTFDSDPIAKYFSSNHKKIFESSASLIVGRKISLKILVEG